MNHYRSFIDIYLFLRQHINIVLLVVSVGYHHQYIDGPFPFFYFFVFPCHHVMVFICSVFLCFYHTWLVLSFPTSHIYRLFLPLSLVVSSVVCVHLVYHTWLVLSFSILFHRLSFLLFITVFFLCGCVSVMLFVSWVFFHCFVPSSCPTSVCSPVYSLCHWGIGSGGGMC